MYYFVIACFIPSKWIMYISIDIRVKTHITLIPMGHSIFVWISTFIPTLIFSFCHWNSYNPFYFFKTFFSYACIFNIDRVIEEEVPVWLQILNPKPWNNLLQNKILQAKAQRTKCLICFVSFFLLIHCIFLYSHNAYKHLSVYRFIKHNFC